MNERIRELRKIILNKTQEEFAKKINVSRSNLGNIETGIINVTDRVVTDICKTYNVSEKWLRTGEGTTFNSSPEIELGYLIGSLEAEENEFKKKFITFMLKQPDSNWIAIENMILEFNEILNKK